MRTPPLLLGATLLLWGWRSGYVVVAAVMAIVVESSWLIKARWELSERDFDRLWNFCTVLFLSAAVYAFTSGQGPNAVAEWLRAPGSVPDAAAAAGQTLRSELEFFRWLPMIFFPFMMAQVFSRRDAVDWSVFFLYLRRKRAAAEKSPWTKRLINVTYPYLAICLTTACIGPSVDNRFFPALCGLLAWALWQQRSRRFAIPVWAGSVVAAAALGFGGQRGLFQLYAYLQDYNPSWLNFLTRGRPDPKESRTSIGTIGRLKLSGHIVLRVEPKPGTAPPPLLREATYSAFRSPSWFGAGGAKDFHPVNPERDDTTWRFLPRRNADALVTIAGYLDGGRGLLALPSGTTELQNLPVFTLKTNSLGTVRVESGPGFVHFDSHYRPGVSIDSAPGEADREVPEVEQPAIRQVAGELGLTNQPPAQVLKTLSAFFEDKFRYSLVLTAPRRGRTNQTALASFLLQDRSGHCEYFATATALLLRQAGIPARYAVGYAVQEHAGSGWIVRDRHAHAWCLAYVNGAWRDFDTTPSTWGEIEAKRASMFEFLTDAWSRLWFEFTKFRYGQSGVQKYIWWFVGVLLVLTLGRLFFGKQWKRFRQERALAALHPAYPGLDSELYHVEKALAARGVIRRSNESLAHLLQRGEAMPALATMKRQLQDLLSLHYRYRFDPAGISATERDALRVQANHCVRELARG
jgi:transglutaminase-like putative cysteine protease